jgi:NADH:ubiquinone oxidoreductase subunit 6 (subunit J)
MLVTEVAYPLYRAPITSMYNTLWYSGAIMYVFRFFVVLAGDDTYSVPHGRLTGHSI